MTEAEGFKAMFEFLSDVYERTNSSTLGSLLGSMSLLDDDMPADSAIWSDWLHCVQKVKNGEAETGLDLSPPSYQKDM